MMRWVIICVLCCLVFTSEGQTLSEEMRARFVEDQDKYLQQLDLSLDQRRAYQSITIKYEKIFMSIYRSDLNAAGKKRQVKRYQKDKDGDMKKILTQSQFKQYLNRQKAIAKYYEE